MASRSEEDLCCSICHDIYRDPVVLSCSHSFCRVCVENWWETTETRQCPVCKRRHSRDLRLNLALRNVCETFLQQSASESVCRLHQEEFKLFCVDHQQPLCVVCRDSEQHSGHKITPINEAAPIFKEQLQQTLQPLKDKRQDLYKRKFQFSATEAHIEAQARLTQRQIQEQFKKLHQFLEEEEQSRIRALREEEEQKKKSMKDKMEAVSREIEALSETITATEEQLRAADVSFLLQYKAAVERVQRWPLVEGPQLGPGALIDQAKHLGNLGFNIWKKMKDLVQFYLVILDHNTSHSKLILSEDLTSVRYGEKQQVQKNPERFKWYRVLGSEGFTSGTHSWDVEVSRNTNWAVGVMNESVQRKGPIDTGVWEIYFYKAEYYAHSPPDPPQLLSVKNLQRVRVKLDFDKGTLTFSDTDTNTHLHTFTHCYSERLFPCFYTKNRTQLKVLPLYLSVTVN